MPTPLSNIGDPFDETEPYSDVSSSFAKPTNISPVESPPPPADDFGVGSSAVGDHATGEDSLGFASYVECIAAFLTSPATEPPLTLSVEGEWGSGKSSFMLQLESAITGPSRRAIFFKNLPTAFGGYTDITGQTRKAVWSKTWKAGGRAVLAARKARKQPPVIRFNAWRHDKQDALWAAFALAVAARLRRRIGFLRAWSGDLRLFRMRLKGPRGWLELLLLLISIAIFLVTAYILGLHILHSGLRGSIIAFNQLPSGAKNQKLDELYAELFTKTAAAHGSIAGFFLLAIAGLFKFKEQIKLPIAIDLKKYLSTPDYEGHSAFIEHFHEDFARLMRAYARNERVFVFIDDLDRCDVPRAAELMQAINLMIADTGQLIFVLGMDREKVAAGITQKYKDLLPFLPEYASTSSAGQEGNQLAFGYSYLEKFIQLSFTLPVIGNPETLEKFLDSLLPHEPRPTWKRQIAYHWTPRLSRNVLLARGFQRLFGAPVSPRPPHGDEPGGPTPSSTTTRRQPSGVAAAIKTEAAMEVVRLQIAEDSGPVRAIAAMVAPIFANNPRRLKQFVTSFRLSMTLADSQRILSRNSVRRGVTPQQLGKFIALTMRFPDLRAALADNPEILEDLENRARPWPGKPEPLHLQRWLNRHGVRTVLLHSAGTVIEERDLQSKIAAEYSMANLDIRLLLSLLPKASPEPMPVAPAPGSSSAPMTVDDLK